MIFLACRAIVSGLVGIGHSEEAVLQVFAAKHCDTLQHQAAFPLLWEYVKVTVQ